MVVAIIFNKRRTYIFDFCIWALRQVAALIFDYPRPINALFTRIGLEHLHQIGHSCTVVLQCNLIRCIFVLA